MVDPAPHAVRQERTVSQVRALLRRRPDAHAHRAGRGNRGRLDVARGGLGLAHVAGAGPGGERAFTEAGGGAREAGLRRRGSGAGAHPGAAPQRAAWGDLAPHGARPLAPRAAAHRRDGGGAGAVRARPPGGRGAAAGARGGLDRGDALHPHPRRPAVELQLRHDRAVGGAGDDFPLGGRAREVPRVGYAGVRQGRAGRDPEQGLPAGGAGGVALDPGPPARGQPRCDRFRAADPGAAPRGFLHPVEGFMAAKFQGVDFYNVDGLLSEEERAVRDTVRAWVDDNLMPVIAEHYLEGRFPKHLVPQMAELGLFGANLPEEYGCAGLNHVAYGLIMQELERGDSGVRSFASVQGALVMYPIFAFGTEEQKKRWLPKMASGEVIGCFGLTEPDYGSNPAGMITVAKEMKDGWVLNGAKMWITNGSTAQAAIVWAKTGKLDDVNSIRGFIVPTDTKGFSAKDQKGKLSLRASDTSELVLQDACIPKDALLPKSGGLKSPLMCLTQARYGIAWGAVGAAMACYDEAVSYAKNRLMFGKPIGGFQLQQARLAEMLTEITKAQLLCLQLGRLKDQGTVTPQQVSLAKRNNVSMATDIAREARRLLGANGILAEYQAMRHLANLESEYTYEGTHDIHTLILGQEITGLSAFN